MGTKTTFIYALTEPDTGTVRYIGKANDPEVRLRNHIKESRNGHADHKARWITKLLREGKRPELKIIEECLSSEWKEREQYWIEQYRASGKLTNHKNGGDGTEVDEAARLKMSLAKKGKPPHNKGKSPSESTRQKQSEAAKRRFDRMTPEQRQAYTSKVRSVPSVHASGWKHTDEAKIKIGEAARGNKYTAGRKRTEEQRRRIAAGQTGKKRSIEARKSMSLAQRVIDNQALAEIRNMLEMGIKQRDIAARFGVSEYVISNIKLGKSYRDLP